MSETEREIIGFKLVPFTTNKNYYVILSDPNPMYIPIISIINYPKNIKIKLNDE